jgi:hypothetical protein
MLLLLLGQLVLPELRAPQVRLAQLVLLDQLAQRAPRGQPEQLDPQAQQGRQALRG